MIIYVDILLLLNFLVTYFLLIATEKICSINTTILKRIISSFIGALTSLFIFLDNYNFLISLILKLLPAVLMTLISFGYKNIKFFIRNLIVFFTISFLYAGLMLFVSVNINNSSIFVNNGAVYIDISPILLILTTLISCIFIIIFNKIFHRNSVTSDKCNAVIILDNISISVTAIIDTGHTLKDNISDKYVSVLDEHFLKETGHFKIFKNNRQINYPTRFRYIPCSTVSGNTMLEALKFDKLIITIDKKIYCEENPLIAFTDSSMGDDFSMIISPKLLEFKEQKNENNSNKFEKNYN